MCHRSPAASLVKAGKSVAPLLRYFIAQHASALTTCCASLLRYPADVTDPRDELIAATRRYRRTETAHDEARLATIQAVVAALLAGVGPTEVERLSPFTGAYIRKIARENQVPPAAPGPKKSSGSRTT